MVLNCPYRFVVLWDYCPNIWIVLWDYFIGLNCPYRFIFLWDYCPNIWIVLWDYFLGLNCPYRFFVLWDYCPNIWIVLWDYFLVELNFPYRFKLVPQNRSSTVMLSVHMNGGMAIQITLVGYNHAFDSYQYNVYR